MNEVLALFLDGGGSIVVSGVGLITSSDFISTIVGTIVEVGVGMGKRWDEFVGSTGVDNSSEVEDVSDGGINAVLAT